MIRPKLVSWRRRRLAVGSTATLVNAPVDAAGAIRRHRLLLLRLTMIPPLLRRWLYRYSR